MLLNFSFLLRSTGLICLITSIYICSLFYLSSTAAQGQPAKASGPVSAKNKSVLLQKEPMEKITRVVSMAPSNTELIYSLGASDRLVGVSSVCDYPAGTKDKTKAGTFVALNEERLTILKPQLVVFVSGQEYLAAAAEKRGIKSIVLENRRLSDISGNIRLLAKIIGDDDKEGIKLKGEKLAAAFERSLTELKKLTTVEHKPKVFYCVWAAPLLTAGGGSYLNEAIDICGGKNIASATAGSYPRFNPERLVLEKPEIVIIASQTSTDQFWTKPPWTLLPAHKSGRVFALPKAEQDSLSRPTTRLVDGLYWLALKIHPELKELLAIWLRETKSRLKEF